jgi:lipopolysaccharide export system protein LptC
VYSVQNPTYQAGMPAGLDARFARAARHSRMVRALRIAVPAVVGLAMAGLIAIAVFNPFRALAKLPLEMDNLVVSGTKITMESPHLSGFTPDKRPYEMWAKTATQDITDPDHVELHTLRAKVLMEDHTTVTLDSRTGVFDTKTQMLDLHKDILMRSSTGYEARLTHALVDMGLGTVTSDQPVDVKLLNGTLTADTMKVTEKGDVVRFENNVVMHLVMDRPLPTAGPADEETAPPLASAKLTHTSHGRSHTQRNSGGETK